MYIQGIPILQDILDNCHYAFEWATNVICPTFISDFREKPCEIYNNQTNATTNLQTIFKDGLISVSYIRLQ